MLENILPQVLVPGLYGLLHLTALILALVYYRRCPGACSLVVAASLLNLTATIARILYQILWLPQGGNFMMFGNVMAGLNLVSWVAYGLMVVAVFVGRHPPAPSPYRDARRDTLDDDDWGRPAAPRPPDSTGIHERN